jgi:hypothetical protein
MVKGKADDNLKDTNMTTVVGNFQNGRKTHISVDTKRRT